MSKRKVKISSIEILGILGLFVWMLTIFLRKHYSINSIAPIFCVTPNFGGAWLATAMLKQLFSPAFGENKVTRVDFTRKVLFYICIVVMLMALINEFLPFLNIGTSFDLYDVMATLLAEIIAFSLPVILKEKILIEYN